MGCYAEVEKETEKEGEEGEEGEQQADKSSTL